MRTAQTTFLGLLILVLGLPASGQWTRVLYSGKGVSTDVPTPRSLSYFTATPALRDDGNDFCVDCSPQGRAKSAKQHPIRPVVKTVGFMAGFRILDVLYFMNSPVKPDQIQAGWKSILVQVGPDRYREIFHLQASGNPPPLQSSHIIHSDGERVLTTMDFDGGVGGGCWEGYWWFDHSGPHSLDFSHLQSAMSERLPKGSKLGSITCSQLDLKSGRAQSAVQKINAECAACDFIGEVTAQFRLHGAIVEPVAVAFASVAP